jgi:type IV secretion system protein VirB10
MTPPNETPDQTGPGPIRDQRTTPRGVLPRHLQTWLMVGLALTILGVILVTGRTSPAPRTGPTPGSPTPRALTPDRIQAYQRQLADDQARLQRELDAAASASATAPAPATARGRGSREPVAAGDPVADEQRRREYQSLFTDNVAFTRRSGEVKGLPSSDAMARSAPVASAASSAATPATAPLTAAAGVASPTAATTAIALPTVAPGIVATSGDGKERLTEGTVIETVLINRLDGTFAGPVTCLVTTPVYQIGDTGVRDQVNRHYLQVFGASIAIGALSGLAQFGTTAGYAPSDFENEYRQAAGASLAASAGRVLDRYLNVLPTITIREGYRIKIYLTADLELPRSAPGTDGGGQ